MRERPGIERITIAALASANGGLAAFVGLCGLGLPLPAAGAVALVLALIGTLWLSRRLPDILDGERRKRPLLSAAWLLIALAALAQTARLSTFMVDPTQTAQSLLPHDQWLVEHCCLTAYNESARFVEEDAGNIYQESLYTGRKLGSFGVDLYHYPPPFLLLPLAVRAIGGGDFLSVRAIWFALSALALMLGLGLMASRLEPAGRLRAIGMIPLVWCSMPVLAGLQMSNFQIMVIGISAIAFALLALRPAAGSLLLAMGAVAKIFPGILVVYLLAQRKWKETLWTAGWGVGLFVAALLIVGPAPFRAFVEFEIPRLSSGEAFSLPFSREFAVARNMAPFGIPLKLGALGIPGMTLEVGRVVSTIYLLGVVGLALWSGRRRTRSMMESISVWLSLLMLGSLASPFAPGNYVLVPLVWLVAFNRELFRPATAVAVWLVVALPFFIAREAPFLVQALASMPSQALAIGVPAVMLWTAGLKRAGEEVSEAGVARPVADGANAGPA